MSRIVRSLSMAAIVLAAMPVYSPGGQPSGERGENVAAAGPRGPTGPDVPLSDAEKKQFAHRVSVAGRTAAAVQTACKRAAKEGVGIVFLPAGEYVFESTVRVPGGTTLLGEGSMAVCRTKGRDVHMYSVEGDLVRFTRLKLQGEDTTTDKKNNTYGISASGKKNVRVDHCELLGFSYATSFAMDAVAQLDHCFIHHNLRDGFGYGVCVYAGAYVLVTDNEFSQNRHSLASNGRLDWSSPKTAGKYLHKPGRLTHWEFLHNRVGGNDQSNYELCAVDTHSGMDGTFVVEGNLFDGARHAVGIRDGSGIIRGNIFRNLQTKTKFRPLVAVSIGAGPHNGVPVDGCMPHDIELRDNVFQMPEGVKYEKCSLGKAENVTIDGKLAPATKVQRTPPPNMPRLRAMNDAGVLREE